MLLPSVEGEEGGNWIVIDSGMLYLFLIFVLFFITKLQRYWGWLSFLGSLIVHALDEKARAYYNLEQLWTSKESTNEQTQIQVNTTIQVLQHHLHSLSVTNLIYYMFIRTWVKLL